MDLLLIIVLVIKLQWSGVGAMLSTAAADHIDRELLKFTALDRDQDGNSLIQKFFQRADFPGWHFPDGRFPVQIEANRKDGDDAAAIVYAVDDRPDLPEGEVRSVGPILIRSYDPSYNLIFKTYTVSGPVFGGVKRGLFNIVNAVR